MPRANNASEVFARLSEAGYIRDASGGGSTTLDSAVTADGANKTVDVVDASGFSVDDLVRLGTEGTLEVHKVNATDTGSSPNTITFDSVIAFDHDSGATVQGQEKVVLGEVTDDGITEDITADRNDINVATRSPVYTRLITAVDARLEFSVENVNVDNYLFSVGVPEDQLTGSGTQSSMDQAVLDGAEIIDGRDNISVYFTGVMDDGDSVEVHGWNAFIDPNRSRTWNTGTGAPIPMAADVSTLVTKIWS